MGIYNLAVDDIDLSMIKAGVSPVIKVIPLDDDTILFMTAFAVKKKDAGKAWSKLSAVQKEKL
jgi:hypothetical protein